MFGVAFNSFLIRIKILSLLFGVGIVSIFFCVYSILYSVLYSILYLILYSIPYSILTVANIDY